MALTKEFSEAVENGNKIRVRIMLKDIMLVDPSLKTFDEMIKHAEQNMNELYDSHNGEELNNDSSSWNEDYMNKQMVSVVTNFSKERINLLGKIVKKLYGYKIQKDTVSTQENNSSDKYASAGKLTGVQIAGGIVGVAGAAATVGGIVSSSIPLITIGIVSIAGGIVMFGFGQNKEV